MISDFSDINTLQSTQKTKEQLAEEIKLDVAYQHCLVDRRHDQVKFSVYFQKNSVTSIDILSQGFRAYFLNRFFGLPDYKNVLNSPVNNITFIVEIFPSSYFLEAVYTLSYS